MLTAGIGLGGSAELIWGMIMLLRELEIGVVVVVVVIVEPIELLLVGLGGNRGKFLKRLKLFSLGFIIS